MRHNFKIVIVSLLTVLTFWSTISIISANERQKARYYYLEGSRLAGLERQEEAYEYYKKAYLTDPSYSEAAHAYGTQRIGLRNDTLKSRVEMLRSFALMKDYVEENPADIYAGQFYAFISTRLDTIEEAIRVYERMDSLAPKETYNLLSLADAYMMARQNKKAVSALEKYERIEGKHQAVSLKKISYMLASGDTIGALSEATELISLNPRDPSYSILKGNLFEIIGENDSTLRYYLEAERLSPDNGAVKMSLANFYRETGDSVAYDEKMYEALLSEDFILDEKLSILSDYLQILINEKGETQRGDHLFQVLMDQYPHETAVLDLAARYNAAKGDYKAAEEQIGYAIDLDASNPDYWTQLIRYQWADDRHTDAIKSYDLAKEHINIPEGLTLLMASLAIENKQYDRAEEAYYELIRLNNPDIPVNSKITDRSLRTRMDYDELIRMSTLYNLLGDLYYTEGRPEDAYTAYDNSLYFYGSNAMTLNNYAYFMAVEGSNLEKAQEMSRQALREDQDNPVYLDTYAWILYKKGEYEEAFDYQRVALEKAKERELEIAEYYDHLGDILFKLDKKEEAIENWEKAYELEPDNEKIRKKIETKSLIDE